MKNLSLKSSSRRLISFLLILLSPLLVYAQLNGDITIGSGETYTTITDAVNALNSSGFTGHLKFIIKDGTYNEQVEINEFVNSDENNTITFTSQSGDSTAVIIAYESASDNNYIIRLNGTDYITIENITLWGAGNQYTHAIDIIGTTQNVTIQNCELRSNAPVNAGAQSTALIHHDRANITDVTILNNYIVGGMGVYFLSHFSAPTQGVKILNNTFENGYGGVFLEYQNAPVIDHNILINKDRRGFELVHCDGALEITNNKVEVHQSFALSLTYCDGGVPPFGKSGLIANNFLTANGPDNSDAKGIIISGCTYQDIYNNSVNIIGKSFLYAQALYLNAGDHNIIKNNIFANQHDGYACYVASPGQGTEIDYNNYYSPANFPYYWNERLYSLEEFKTASGMDVHSQEVYPNYTSDFDLHTLSPWLNNKGDYISEIPEDIDGISRSDPPDIGAAEFTPLAGTTTPLNGAYQIGSNPYYSFSDALEDVLLKGVNGPVVFNVASGQYNEQLIIQDVPGASEQNTITFRSSSGDPDDVILYFYEAGIDNNYVVLMKGADNWRFKDLTFRSNTSPVATYGRVFQLFAGTEDLKLDNCRLIGSPVNNSGADALAVLYSYRSVYTSRVFDNNLFQHGSYSFFDKGYHNIPLLAGLELVNNEFKEAYFAVALDYHDSPRISGNLINETVDTGLHVAHAEGEIEILNNHLFVDRNSALYLESCDGSEPRGLVVNNFMHAGGTDYAYGMRIYNTENIDFYHNSVSISSTSALYGRSLYVNAGQNLNFVNNIFSNSGGGVAYYVDTPAAFSSSDYNDLYTTGVVLAKWNAVDQADLVALQSTSGMETNSVSLDPQYVSTTNLHASAAGIDGAAQHLEAVPFDIDGQPRHPSTPDIGADEFGQAVQDIFIEKSVGLAGAAWGSTQWGDYDSDGSMDILITGSDANGAVLYIYNNDQGVFTSIPHSIEALAAGCAAWGDYNNDNQLDIFISGSDDAGEIHSRIYFNDGFGNFSNISATLSGVNNSSVDLGDYDNDGDLDIVLAGTQGGLQENVTFVYRNEGDGIFSELDTNIPGVRNAKVIWSDFNTDGKLDIFMIGEGLCRIYENQGNDLFYSHDIGMSGLIMAAAACDDFDNDGDPDIVVSGSEGGYTYVTKLYRNEGNYTFSERVLAGLPGIAAGDLKWGDFDNDGYLDLFMIGANDSYIEASVYHNNLNSTFSKVNFDFKGAMDGSISISDFDLDGKLDVVYSGRDQNLNYTTMLYQNNANIANTQPQIPANLIQSISSDFALLQWDLAQDNETLQAGLTYNIRIGTSSRATDTATPMSTDGYLFLAKNGNRGNQNRIFVEDLEPNTTYYWSVQSVDKGYLASAFSVEESFQTQPAAEGPFLEHPESFIGMTGGDLVWAKFFFSIHEQIVQTGWYGNLYGNKTQMFDKVDGRYEEYTANLQNLDRSALDVGDFDNDGDLDIINIGSDFGVSPFTILYQTDTEWPNSLSPTFTPIQTLMPDVYDGDVAFADFDNDGDLDILLTGKTSSDSIITGVYSNEGLDLFGRWVFDITQSGITGVIKSAVSWIDYDKDGDHDFILSGETVDGTAYTALYNNSAGTFSPTGDNFIQLKDGSVAWGDYDANGYPDILLCGLDNSDVPHTLIYKNMAGQFIDSEINLLGIHAGNAIFVDYDSDGDYDIAMSGKNAAGENITQLYSGDGSGIFGTFNDTGIMDLGGGAIAWGHADADKKIDVAVSGTNGNERLLKIYHNNMPNENTHPQEPVILEATVISNNEVEFSWHNDGDAETQPAVLTYNLRIGTTPGGEEIMAASNDGVNRRSSRHGNVGHNLSWRIKGLNRGQTYYWAVQAVDNGFLASDFKEGAPVLMSSVFSSELNFSIDYPLSNGEIEWFDSNRDGRMDIFINGQLESGTWVRTILRNSGNGNFDQLPAAPNFLAGAEDGDIEFGDLDGDDDLDLIMTGRIAGERKTSIYEGIGNNEYVYVKSLIGLSNSSVRLGDINNNGTLDVLLLGKPGDVSGRDEKFVVALNDHEYSFPDGFVKDGFRSGSIDMGDFDNDDDLDIAMMGFFNGPAGQNEYRSKILNNITTIGELQTWETDFVGLEHGQCKWVDIDNDGDLDVFFTGRDGYHFPHTFYALNIGGSFHDIKFLPRGYSFATMDFGDYDHDGDMDLLICGKTESGNFQVCIWDNHNGSFIESEFKIGFHSDPRAAFGDYDNDGDLDIFITAYNNSLSSGGESNRHYINRLYKNNIGKQNFPPEPPDNLSSQVGTKTTILAWNPGSDQETPTQTLTYNLRIGTHPGYNDVMPSMAKGTGKRFIVAPGNVNHNLSWRMMHLPAGKYYWSVQTIDQCYLGSAFAVQDSFEVPELTRNPEIVSVTDVPHDQGGKVQIRWNASWFDTTRDSLSFYSVWRAIPDALAFEKKSGNSDMSSANVKYQNVQEKLHNKTDSYWEWIVDLPANQFVHYAYTAHTLYDSTSRSDGQHQFMVIAHTTDVDLFWYSNIYSGYSVDNISPSAPANVNGKLDAGAIEISWSPNWEKDFKQYLVYRSSSPNIDPTLDSVYAVVSDTLFTDAAPMPGISNYYIVCAQDIHDNISDSSNEVEILVTGISRHGADIPTRYALHQNYPNPFNPYTTIGFELPEKTQVRLVIYNLLGKTTKILIDRFLPAGRYNLRWEPVDMASGLYIYQLQTRNFIKVRKMLLVK